MSTNPIVRIGKTPLSHSTVPWSHTVSLADFLDKAKEAQREVVRIAHEEAEAAERVRMTSSKYRAYRKIMPQSIPGRPSDPLRQSPLRAAEISQSDEFTQVVSALMYDERIRMLFAEACEAELRNVHVRLTTLQEVISKFIRMHPPRR